jgi:NADH:ubiquinone oxidoreductase subunit E
MPYFSQELTKIIEGYLKRYETKRSSILPILHAIQDEKDWISDQDIDALEKEFGLSAIDVREVMTFYTMYRKSPPKPYRFEICKSICSFLNDGQLSKQIRSCYADLLELVTYQSCLSYKINFSADGCQ